LEQRDRHDQMLDEDCSKMWWSDGSRLVVVGSAGWGGEDESKLGVYKWEEMAGTVVS
jgi:hypothetical protein